MKGLTMIRVYRNLAALCFLLAVTAFPANAVARQDEPLADCGNVSYADGGDTVNFSNCTDSCGWLRDHCFDYCEGADTWFDCFGDGESLNSGFCECYPEMQ